MVVRATKFVSAVVGGLFVGMSLAIAQPAQSAANATDCLTAPRQDTPQGQHWYYHLERGTKRKCWYLRGEGGDVAQAASADDSQSAASAPPAQAEPAARSLEDARAEFPAPQPQPAPQDHAGSAPVQAAPAGTPSATPAASSPFPDPPQAAPAAGSAVASRWPGSADPSAAPPVLAADATDAGASSQMAPMPSATPAPPADESAPKASGPASASLQMLMVVILGALALAGLTASIVYRFGRGRRIRVDARQRRAAIWEGVDDVPSPPWVEPVIEKAAPLPDSVSGSSRKAVPQERYQKIEELLAQLVKQAQESEA